MDQPKLTNNHLRLFFITADPEIAAFVVDNGADRLFVDLEINGKVERQGHLSTVISRHSPADVTSVRRAAPDAELMVRLNPVHEKTQSEVDDAIERGADILMLPMFHEASEVQQFSEIVGGRSKICLLVETSGAMNNLPAILDVAGIDELHIGLNDLHLSLGNSFMFEPLADGLVETMTTAIASASLPFGIGGIARAGEGDIPAELVLAEHARLGSTGAILSRTFHRNSNSVQELRHSMDFGKEVEKLRSAYREHLASPRENLDRLHAVFQEKVSAVVDKRRSAANRTVQT